MRKAAASADAGTVPTTTPVAVALSYDPARDDAPKVVAAGRGSVAEQILNLAFALGIKVREDADLAELLAAVDIDCEIPAAAFAAVAEILVYMYRANGLLPPQGSDADAVGVSG